MWHGGMQSRFRTVIVEQKKEKEIKVTEQNGMMGWEVALVKIMIGNGDPEER